MESLTNFHNLWVTFKATMPNMLHNTFSEKLFFIVLFFALKDKLNYIRISV